MFPGAANARLTGLKIQPPYRRRGSATKFVIAHPPFTSRPPSSLKIFTIAERPAGQSLGALHRVDLLVVMWPTAAARPLLAKASPGSRVLVEMSIVQPGAKSPVRIRGKRNSPLRTGADRYSHHS